MLLIHFCIGINDDLIHGLTIFCLDFIDNYILKKIVDPVNLDMLQVRLCTSFSELTVNRLRTILKCIVSYPTYLLIV